MKPGNGVQLADIIPTMIREVPEIENRAVTYADLALIMEAISESVTNGTMRTDARMVENCNALADRIKALNIVVLELVDHHNSEVD